MITLGQITELVAGQFHGDVEASNLAVSEIGLDSQNLPTGAVFAALPGTSTHGANFAAETAAAAVLTDATGVAILQEQGYTQPIIEVVEVRRVLGNAAAAIYGDPSQDLTIIGVTGTSGKTTTSYLIEAGLMAAGCSVGLIGTTGTRINSEPVPSSLTTPEAPILQKLFRQMRDAGVTHVVMEVSSHALSLGRVQGTHFAVAGFTNLTQDHLDFHKDMEDYFQAKALLFDPDSPVHADMSVICIDDVWGQRLAEIAAGEVRTVSSGANPTAQLRATDICVAANGAQNFQLRDKNEKHLEVALNVPGRFNVANAALAIGIAEAIGLADAQLESFITALATAFVPGRMQRIAAPDYLVVVDYAHKPAAVTAVLETIRQEVEGRLLVVIGAGGNRDTGKRPLMGAEAARLADLVFVTDDNPRDEDPAAIRAAVIAGTKDYPDAEVIEIGSRAAAIQAAIQAAQPGDAVAILGKGHEIGQLVAGVQHHFDDREEAAQAIAKRSHKLSAGM